MQEAETYSQGNKRVIKNKKLRQAVGWVKPPMLAAVRWVGFWGDGMEVGQSKRSKMPCGWFVGSSTVRAVQLDPKGPFSGACEAEVMMETRCGIVDFRLSLRHKWRCEPQSKS